MSEPPIQPEVLPPGAPLPPMKRTPSPMPTPLPDAPAPFHPFSAALLIVVDNLWNLAEWTVIGWLLTIPLSFLSVSVPVFWIQRRQNGDRRRVALAKAVFLGVVAAVPFSVTGTPVGLALLAWAGFKHPWKRV